MTTFSAVVVYARTKKEVLGYVPEDLRDEPSEGSAGEVAIATPFKKYLVHGSFVSHRRRVRPMPVEDLWALERAHDFTGYAFKYRPVGASDTELQTLINEVTERGLHWAVAL